MSLRQKYQDGMASVDASKVLDIPDLGVIDAYGADHDPLRALVREFESKHGEFTGIVFPAVGFDGVTFPISTARLPQARGRSLQDLLLQVARDPRQVYISLEPSFAFLNSPISQLIDSSGDASNQVCIAQPYVQENIALVLIDALTVAHDAGVDAPNIVLDGVDFWPMGVDSGKMELTCFCHTCTAFLAGYLSRAEMATFRESVNPWSLVLAENDRGTGISYVDEFSSTTTPDGILQIAEQKGFLKDMKLSPARLGEMAGLLLTYTRARHALTIESLGNVIALVASELEVDVASLGCALIAEGSPYNWTGGFFLDLLASDAHGIAEVWVDPSPGVPFLSDVPHRTYMSRRSRYLIDAFFSFRASSVDLRSRSQTGLARFETSMLEDMIRSRFRQAASSVMEGPAAMLGVLSAVSEDEGARANHRGFVMTALSREMADVLTQVDITPELREMGRSD